MSANIALIDRHFGQRVARALGPATGPDAQRLAASAWCMSCSPAFSSPRRFSCFASASSTCSARAASSRSRLGFSRIVVPANFLPLGVRHVAAGPSARSRRCATRHVCHPGGALVTALLDPLLIFGLHLGVKARFRPSCRGSSSWRSGHGARSVTRVSSVVRSGAPSSSRISRRCGRSPQRRSPTSPRPSPTSTPGASLPASAGDRRRARHHRPRHAVAFGVLFAMTGSVGPIIGQNFAGLYPRIRRAMTDCFRGGDRLCPLGLARSMADERAHRRHFPPPGGRATSSPSIAASAARPWLFLAGLFVANAAFNNLRYPGFATLFNWGRATSARSVRHATALMKWGR